MNVAIIGRLENYEEETPFKKRYTINKSYI